MTKSLIQTFNEAYIDDDEDAIQEIVELAQQDPNLVASHYYFHVKEAINYYSQQPEVSITITPKVYFDIHGCIYDQYMEPLEIILGEDASEIASSSYTMNYPFSLVEVENFLLSKGFIKDSKFDQFLK
jgi:hypothetical protein